MEDLWIPLKVASLQELLLRRKKSHAQVAKTRRVWTTLAVDAAELEFFVCRLEFETHAT
jgi:hypothetical protein